MRNENLTIEVARADVEFYIAAGYKIVRFMDAGEFAITEPMKPTVKKDEQ